MQYIVIFLIFVSSCLPDSGGGTQEGTGSQGTAGSRANSGEGKAPDLYFAAMTPTDKTTLRAFLENSYNGRIIDLHKFQKSPGLCVLPVAALHDNFIDNITPEIRQFSQNCSKGFIFLLLKLTQDPTKPVKTVIPALFADKLDIIEINFKYTQVEGAPEGDTEPRFDIPANKNFPEEFKELVSKISAKVR